MEEPILAESTFLKQKTIQIQSWVSKALDAKLHPKETSSSNSGKRIELNDVFSRSIRNLK